MAQGETIATLYAALASPCGLIVRSSDGFVAMSRRAYAARAQSGDPALKALSFRRPPNGREDEMWIIKKDAQAPTPEGAQAQGGTDAST